MNNILCKQVTRYGFVDRYIDGDIKKVEKNIDFIDFIIDGKSLYDSFRAYDFISVLAYRQKEQQHKEIQKLLLLEPTLLESGRYFLFVCPMCADISCGAVTVSIKREGDLIIWSDFTFENGNTSNSLDVGSFVFKWSEYSSNISLAFLKE